MATVRMEMGWDPRRRKNVGGVERMMFGDWG
jgi:hypothetical protein